MEEKKEGLSNSGYYTMLAVLSVIFVITVIFAVFMGIKYYEATHGTKEIGNTQYIDIK